MSASRDELEAVVLFLSMRVRALEARVAPGGLIKPQRFVLAATAFKRAGFPFSEKTIQRLCQRHSDTWAILLGRRWHVRQPDFDQYVDLVQRGLTNF